MPQWIHQQHFKDLEMCDPAQVVSRTGCSYDAATRQYRVDVWGDRYCVDLDQCRVFAEYKKPKTYQDFLYLFILFYLIKAQKRLPSNQWISEKDITGGAAFFRGPHSIPVNVITERVKDDIALFEHICTGLGGQPMDLADAAFSFQITPLIPVAVLYWQGDEEFPCDAKLLFDQTIEAHLPLDIVFALAVEVCHGIAVFK